MTRPPIFIVGHPRSGTTWLSSCMGYHTKLAAGGETHLFNLYLRAFYQTPGWLINEWIDKETLQSALRELVCTILDSKLRRTGKERVVEKTPAHRYWMRQMLEMFPEAKFVHIHRDGRDVALSMRSRKLQAGDAWIPDDVTALAQRWANAMRTMKRDQLAIGASHFINVGYEDSVKDARSALRTILAFIEEPADDAILDLMLKGAPPRPTSLGRWHHEFSQQERDTFVAIAGEQLSSFGYEIG